MTLEHLDNFYEKFIATDKAVIKHLNHHHWISGSSTIVCPVTLDKVSNQIELQWGSDNTNTARNFISRMNAHKEVKCAYFIKNDGSCPSVVRITMK